MKITDAYNLLKAGHDAGRMAHSYIVEGDVRGAGTALTDMFVRFLFCKSENRPCGECRTCRDTESHKLPDLYWVEPEKKSRVISVEQIRDLLTWVNKTSYEGGWKICVIVYADRLNNSSANAFLKTLEEPPDKTLLFLLVQNPQFLLPTIVSRCQKITLTEELSTDDEEWKDELTDILARDGSSQSFLGAQGKAELIKQLFSTFVAAADQELSDRLERDGVEMDEARFDAAVQSAYREKRADLMRFILIWYRDIVVLTCGSGDDMLSNVERAGIIREHAAGMSAETALKNVEIVETMSRRLGKMSTGQEIMMLSSGFTELYHNTVSGKRR